MTNMRRRRLVLVALLGCAATPAPADEYWVAYEGNDLPENEGWTRRYGDEIGPSHGGAVRDIIDGSLRIDSTRNVSIYDFASIVRAVDPAVNEMFVMQWRLCVESSAPLDDPGLGVFSDDAFGVAFEFDEFGLRSVFESSVSVPIGPGFHIYELQSPDMRTYNLSIDSVLVLSGRLVQTATSSEVGWGDVIQGGSSITLWDYFRFGVVPEPSSILLLIVGWACASASPRTRVRILRKAQWLFDCR